MEYNVSVADARRTYVGSRSRPELPVLALDGSVSRASCNPHVSLTELKLDPSKFRELIPILNDLIPGEYSSHVAIYVHSTASGREVILREASVSLPHCVVFDESQDYHCPPAPDN
ncbi:hypothetical protein Pla100_61080 [Neorhodopirellula pilleata]|uniref:Uncharacterized protein n=2 Tax=Neorhodopirellula pilleata TaxID=2714738 RepID=A0A5C5ZG12_9BACT|nr:hypothetical protein Pla100_61080 [Neorhodopirellula pilleata]